jgi:hypothetical protein
LCLDGRDGAIFRPPYTDAVSVLAAYLRDRAADEVRRMDPRTRMRVALELGDEDLARYCAAHGVDPAEGRRRLMRQRQAGRRPSVAANR